MSDEIYKQVNDFIVENGLNRKLTKKWDTYKNSMRISNGAISLTDYNILVEKAKKREEQALIRQAEKERQNKEDYENDLETLALLKSSYEKDWLNMTWIEAMIGTFSNPFAEYYWTLIGRKGYKILDWKGNISIREDIYTRIANDKTFKTYPGKYFLNRSFKNKKGYSAYIQGTFPLATADESGYGIYGIYYESDNQEEEPELIYIGMTQKGFTSRWEEHMDIFTNRRPPTPGMSLYTQNLDPSKILFEKLINVSTLKYEGVVGLQELKAMELTCITLFQPKYNILGITKPYIL